MSGVEQRKEIRFPAHVLPEEYRTFSILLSQGKTATVKTVDASRNGFGFTAHLSSDNFILGSKIVLYPFGESRPVYGIIVYAQ
ncbi:MAG TPA: hypothetical protein VJ861_05620, partial [Treponemataceae bacterium]|nr:hypothetical protein [Treponemataceae bacterium]